ncbi:hypothetical protein QCA50_006629 [Cerrena zonata]|uniref:Ketopantoate reductase C-terminal domain-containing protein n=1 Tax=Cerrena zonata TaxID=2478898 RepID=A0AAW0GEJ6_9APHY
MILFSRSVQWGMHYSLPTDDGVVFTEDKARGILKGMGTLASKVTSNERPSILVDVESGRPTEVEVLVGEVVRMGRKLAVPTPRLETFYAILLITQTELLHKCGIRR